MQKQRTLKTEVSYTGIGLHSGREVHATLKPAPEDTAIVFVRKDLSGEPQIHAKAQNVTSTLRATTVEENGNKVFTIEHLMSAFHAHRIDNAYVELDSEEPPVADGASLVFFELMAKAGIVEQAKDRREIVIDKVYRIDDEKTGRFVMVLPYDGFRVSFTSLNPHKLIGDVEDRVPRVAQRLCGAAGRHQLDPMTAERGGQIGETRLVADGKERTADGNEIGHGGASAGDGRSRRRPRPVIAVGQGFGSIRWRRGEGNSRRGAEENGRPLCRLLDRQAINPTRSP